MTPKTNFPEENKKRAAFKRFSQMSAAGLTVLSMSAFTDISASQLPANVELLPVKERINVLTDHTVTIDNGLSVHNISFMETPHNLYPNYSNNYGNYSDAPYSNNYSNACDNTMN